MHYGPTAAADNNLHLHALLSLLHSITDSPTHLPQFHTHIFTLCFEEFVIEYGTWLKTILFYFKLFINQDCLIMK